MSNNRKIISFRDSEDIVQYLDLTASKLGVDRSDALRMLIREKQRMEADSAENQALTKYQRIK